MKTRTLAGLMIVVALTLLMAAYGCSSVQEPTDSGYVTVDVSAAYQELSIMNKETQIADVREPDEWAATGVPIGAVLIPLGELAERAPAELAQDVPVYVICNSGNRSRTGSQILLDLGYSEVYSVDGGIQAWLAAGLPVESYTP